MRYWIILPSAMISAVGYVLLVAVQMNLGVKLFACFLVAAGVYAAVGLHVTFLSMLVINPIIVYLSVRLRTTVEYMA